MFSFSLPTLLNLWRAALFLSLTFALYIFFISRANAQTHTITGKVVDKDGRPLEGVRILITRSKDSTATTILSDKMGNFAYPITQVHAISLTAIYETDTFFRAQHIAPRDTFLNLQHNTSVALEGVVIHAIKKSTVKQEADKFVFTPSTDLKSGSSVSELFRSTPMLSYTESGTEGTPEVSIVGKNTTEIFINGKRTYMPMETIMSMLNDQDANDVERIEIITNPKASTEVEQGGGIINIILKKKAAGTWTGSVRVWDRQNSKNSGGGGINIQHQAKKLSFDLGVVVNSRGQTITNTTENAFLNQGITQKNDIMTPSRSRISTGGRGNISYDFNEKHSLMVGFGGFFNSRYRNATNTNNFTPANNHGVIDSSYLVNNLQNRLLSVLGVNVEYMFKTDDKGSFFQVQGRAFQFWVDQTTNLNTLLGIGNDNPSIPRLQREQLNPSKTQQLMASATYNHVFNKSQSLESGVRIIQSKTDNKFEVKPDASANSYSIYYQPSYVGFMSHTAEWSKKITTIVGVNMEYYLQRGNNIGSINASSFRRPNLFFLPTVSILYYIAKDHQLSLNFNRSSQRLRFQDINPFRIVQSNNTYSSGNERLLVPTRYETSLSYTLKQSYTFVARYTFNQNPYTKVTIFDPNDVTHSIGTVPYNYGNFQGGYLIASNSQTFFKGYWQMQTTLTGQYTYYKGDIPSFRVDRGGFGGAISWANTLSISKPFKKNKWLATVNFNYTAPSFLIYGLSSQGPNLGLGIKKVFNKWNFNLYINDVTRSNTLVTTTQINGLQTKDIVYRDQLSAMLSITYHFGSSKKTVPPQGVKKPKLPNENHQEEDDMMMQSE